MLTINTQNNTNFTGHCGCQYTKIDGKKVLLTTETAFGRGLDTLEYAVKHINKRFPNIRRKKIVVGACSTGEEVWTLKMLMEDKPVDIIGFDLSSNALKTAKKGVYEMLPPDDVKVILHKRYDGYKDLFLAYDKKGKSVKEQKLFVMFHKMFEEIKSRNFNPFRKKGKTFKLRTNQPDCQFIHADIQHLPKTITESEKCQIFSFRNSFYHILTNHNGISNECKSSKKLKPELDSIMKDINKSLLKGGLFLLGKKEYEQCTNIKLVARALVNNGFKPLKHNEKFCDIWEKVKDLS